MGCKDALSIEYTALPQAPLLPIAPVCAHAAENRMEGVPAPDCTPNWANNCTNTTPPFCSGKVRAASLIWDPKNTYFSFPPLPVAPGMLKPAASVEESGNAALSESHALVQPEPPFCPVMGIPPAYANESSAMTVVTGAALATTAAPPMPIAITKGRSQLATHALFPPPHAETLIFFMVLIFLKMTATDFDPT